jgi:hypothetical protein
MINLQAMPQTTIRGEYMLRKTEMVAGFNFSAAGTFLFFSAMELLTAMPPEHLRLKAIP